MWSTQCTPPQRSWPVTSVKPGLPSKHHRAGRNPCPDRIAWQAGSTPSAQLDSSGPDKARHVHQVGGCLRYKCSEVTLGRRQVIEATHPKYAAPAASSPMKRQASGPAACLATNSSAPCCMRTSQQCHSVCVCVCTFVCVRVYVYV